VIERRRVAPLGVYTLVRFRKLAEAEALSRSVAATG